MTPKFITLHRFAKPHDPLMVNPRRVSMFLENRHPSAQPELKGKLGTEVMFTQSHTVIVQETPEQIATLLS